MDGKNTDRWKEGTLDVVVSAPDFQNRFLDEPGSIFFFFLPQFLLTVDCLSLNKHTHSSQSQWGRMWSSHLIHSLMMMMAHMVDLLPFSPSYRLLRLPGSSGNSSKHEIVGVSFFFCLSIYTYVNLSKFIRNPVRIHIQRERELKMSRGVVIVSFK